MSNLANQLALSERQDVAKGIRLLLAAPLITERTAPESFDLIRRRQLPIAKWFEYNCGWRLVVEPRFGYARLAKVRHECDHTRPARRVRSGRAPFDRRRYTLLCVAAAELLSGPVTTIGLLADRVQHATAADPVLDTFDTSSRTERMAYVDALRFLESCGALEAVDGTTDSFVDSREAKVLYRVDATLLVRLLSAPSQVSPGTDQIDGHWPEALSDGKGWQPLTKKLHGALSGGEKAIALHLPLFAAVAAHYQAVPGAPRMILLDEVFVGVDSSNRGQVFELLTSLDLDLVLTSDHEWCTYREIPGIAIHNLLTGDDGDDAVTTARFVWTGTDWAGDDE